MPVTPVMPSKLSVPEPPAGYLPRERLDRQWREWEQKRLVLVTAGPGYGKTSFLAANARSAGEVCIWLSLDETDGELGSFRAHLDRGLLGAVAGTGMRGASSPSTVSGGLPHEGANEALVRWVQALRDRQRHTYLILDDAHLVTYSPEVIQILGRLIRFLPDTTTMVVASREPLDLAIMKLRSAGRGGMLTAPDLAFTSREVAQLFGRRFQQASLPPRLAREVVARTEGWAAGIEIFFQVLDGVSPRAIEDALASIESAGTSWFAYFAEEVISRLTPETQDFLYRSSVLPRLDGELCDRLLGRRDSLRILNQLRRRNLFTFPCGTGSRSLRYHHLFREFLQDRLRRTLPRADRQKLQRRAARALVKEGAWVDAVRAYAEAGDSEGALRLIERMGDNLLATGQHQALREAFGFIPPTKLRGRHMAQFVLGRLCELQGDWEEADRIFRRILRASRPGGRRAELLRLLATQKVRWGDYRACAALCRRALKEPGLRRSPVRGLLQSLLGVAHCELGDLDEGQRHLEAAAEAFRKNGNSWEQGRNYYLRAANVHYFRGEFRRAKDTARRALAIFRKLGDRRQISHSLGVLAFVTAGAGETHEARELAHQGLRLAESFDYRDLIGYCHLTLGRCALLAGDLAEACEHFEVAREYGEATGEADLRVFSRMGLAECALRRANPSAARKAVTETLSIARGMHDRLQEGQCHFFLGLAVHGSDPRRARSEWDRAEAILRRTGARFEL
ncbi:MAG: tetratricopeptide repeat protein, partial [Candidatus Eisenbacteria sp.]|nr:tetratricopeptide repeat protein [Candidatus Eisenbacteria bacterium]